MRNDLGFLTGGGEMGALMRAKDWAETPLGPVESWPQSLRSAVSILLPSKAEIILFWGPDLVVLYNDAYRPVFGGKHPTALGMPGREAWSEVWEPGLRDLLGGVVRTGEAFWGKDLLFILERHRYPEETYFDVSYDPVRVESGAVGGVFCIVSETTGRVLGERRLRTLRDLAARNSNARSPEDACALALEALRANPHDLPFSLLYLTDEGGRAPIIQCGTPGTALISAPSNWQWADVLASNALALVSLEGKTDIPAGAWPRPPVQAAVVPIPASGGGRGGLFVVGLNPLRAFDDDYRAFLELAAAQISAGIANGQGYAQERHRAEDLASLDRAKTAFFSNVSHEFRTPLTLMLGPVDDALSDLENPLPAAQRDRLALVHRSGLRLQKLVNTLLDFARIEAGRTQASYVPTDLAALTTDLASTFRSTMEKAGLTLAVACPTPAEPAYVDRDMWEKIVLNLLSNAFKFTFDGEITVVLRETEDTLLLSVRDTGSGIPAKDLPHVFERFRRVEGARSRTHEGTGIGLALVHELVKLHGGAVSVTSTEGKGSTFTVSIPKGCAHLPAERVSGEVTLASTTLGADPYVEEALRWLPDAPQHGVLPSEPEVPSWSGAGDRRARILWADDNADMREYVRRLLAPRFDVETVADGEAALAAVQEQHPDLVITDVMMPGIDGLGLLRALRSDPRTRAIPVIMLSARAGEEARIQGLDAGADDYLHKPFSARELLARITARLEMGRLQARILEERGQLAHLFAQTPVATAVLRGPNLVYEMANPAYTEIVGRDVVGKPLLEALPEVEGQGFDDLLRGVMRSGVPYIGRDSRLVLTRNGVPEAHYFTFIYAPLRAPTGEIDAVIVVASEVTGEVRAREMIGASEERYRSIFVAAAVSIWEEDFSAVHTALDDLRARGVGDFRQYFAEHPEFVRETIGLVRIVDVNDATLAMFGARHKRELVESLHDTFLPETEAIFAEQLVAIVEGKPRFEGEAVVRTLSGERRDVLVAIAFPPESAKFTSVLVTLTDITARKRAERGLREEASTLETLNSVGKTLAAELDLEHIVQAVTDASTQLSGAQFGAFFYNVTNDAGQSYMLYTLSGAPREAFAQFGIPPNTAGFGPNFSGDEIVRIDDVTKDPRYAKPAPHHGMPSGPLPVRSYLAVPVVSRSGDVIGGLFLGHSQPGVFTERSERLVSGIASQAAVAIDNARLYQAAQESDRRKDEFIATLSHELRNPLAPLRNALQVLTSHDETDERTAAIHGMMTRQVDHLVRLVDDLLEMSRISRGTVELRRERVELQTVVRNAVETSDPLVRASGHALLISLPDEPLWLDGDPVRLAQILSNLLNNAAKYTEKGGRIAVAAREELGTAVITVSDTGLGIAPGMLPRIFDMFSRGDRAGGRSQEGLGIGLALARRLAEMHGGTITAASEGPGRGSEFTVRLPLAETWRTESTPSYGHRPLNLGSKRILVVDDNHDAGDSLALVLESLGAEVRVVRDGEAALTVLGGYHPTLVLLDIGMPGMDGYEVARRVRLAHPGGQPTLVALTGWGQAGDRRRAREAGFDHHLVKPVSVADLQGLLLQIDGDRLAKVDR